LTSTTTWPPGGKRTSERTRISAGRVRCPEFLAPTPSLGYPRHNPALARPARAEELGLPDRAGQFAASFDAVLEDAGVDVVKIPPRCPRANCFAERLVLTIRTELTDRMLIFGEWHLRRVLAEYSVHDNTRRPHRALQLHPPRPELAVADPRHPGDPAATGSRRVDQRVRTRGRKPQTRGIR
jgi:hypothetical protein